MIDWYHRATGEDADQLRESTDSGLAIVKASQACDRVDGIPRFLLSGMASYTHRSTVT